MNSSHSPLAAARVAGAKRSREVSIADIARVAGVSHTTVSRALRDSPLISEETRKRIQQLALEMGYTPNAIAQSLQTRRTNTIGLAVTSIADPFLSEVVRGIEEVARSAGLSVFLSATHNDPEQEIAVIETFHRRRVDGILVASSRMTGEYKQRLDQIRIPTVLINSQAESQYELLHWVAVDDVLGARLAVEHLLALGHRAIGYVGTSSRPRSCRQRLEGYRAALADAGLTPREEWVTMMRAEEASPQEDVLCGRRALQRLLDAGVTAVFCQNDMMAIGLLMACYRRGIAVPRELSVAGFDDIEMASCIIPPLTTVRQPRLELGRLAMQVLLDLLHEQEGHNHVLTPTLVVRESTAPPLASSDALPPSTTTE
ncbi:LacI family DNA-binding transcriptional regulator [Thermogemmatispora sp.]|uniref:LacI family DNA-binding transcriptional regulator n=1 Tax=Thermogemmatispora sp. TaxID=1968838 RepID=UPI002626CE84|nr:LacI family DNA-binding transcriptional regulator [Thermogemmatispora sp.]